MVSSVVISCLEPYDPPSVKDNPEFIVVDAFVDVSNGSAKVKLSHTVPLNSTSEPEPEDGATVLLQDESGNDFVLPNYLQGLYETTSINLDPGKKYRLYIRTTANKEYQSDFVPVKTSPEIDSITYHVDGFNVLNIHVNSHDVSRSTRFYKWQYVETFEYQSHYPSNYVVKDGTVQPRTLEEDIHTCWKTNQSTEILINSTQKVVEDIVSNFTLLKIERTELRITRKYSILVRQTGLTEDAYNYWLNVQKTTESLGGLFDPMPSQVTGNIHSLSDPDEQVIGYFSAGAVTEKRIFIDQDDLQDHFSQYLVNCPLDTLDLDEVNEMEDPLLFSAVYAPGAPVIIGYTTSDIQCIDCRSLGKGVTAKPDFWE